MRATERGKEMKGREKRESRKKRNQREIFLSWLARQFLVGSRNYWRLEMTPAIAKHTRRVCMQALATRGAAA